MMRTSELDMADSVHPADIDTFIDNAVWSIYSTYHTVLNASPGAAIFGQDMLFDIPFIADWNQIRAPWSESLSLNNEVNNCPFVSFIPC
jgi:hypothetical protein